MGLIRYIDDFDMQSAKPGVCFIRNTTKRKGERGVFRCGNIDMERGWLDISEGAIAEMADMLGWIHPDKAASLTDELEKTRIDLREALRQVDQSRIDTVIEISRKADSAMRKSRRYKKKIDQLNERLHQATGKVMVPLQDEEDEASNDTIEMPRQ